MAGYQLLYTVALISFFLPAFSRLVPILSGSGVRWICLVVLGLATAGLALGRWASVPRLIFFALVPFWLYPLLTVMWSQNPNLTLVKWAVFVLGSGVFLYGGIALARARPAANPFWPLAPLFLVGVLSSFVALAAAYDYAYDYGMGGSGLFQGYVQGPNMLGSIVAISTPWLLVELKRRWHEPRGRAVLLALAALAAIVMLMTRSRSAILFVLGLLTVSLFALPASRRVMVTFVLILTLAMTYAAFPDFYEAVVETYVLKSGRRVMQTREEGLAISLERAREGGNFGIGYGISSRESWEWSWELTSIGFGREKGNSQLAVLEELGVIGFAFYCLLLVAILYLIVVHGRRVRQYTGDRLLGFLMLGFVVGAVIHSSFEAWFTAPGSPEAVTFWAVLGLGLGAMQSRVFAVAR